MTVVLPKGSSGLKAPMRRERPAARRIAATPDSGLWSFVLVMVLGVQAAHLQRLTTSKVCSHPVATAPGSLLVPLRLAVCTAWPSACAIDRRSLCYQVGEL